MVVLIWPARIASHYTQHFTFWQQSITCGYLKTRWSHLCDFAGDGIIFPFPLLSCWTPLDPSQLNFFTYHLPIRMNYSHICRLFFAISESIEIYLSLHTCFTIRGLPRWQSGKETACQCRRRKRMWVWSLSQEDSPREGNGNLLQYSCLENAIDRGA